MSQYTDILTHCRANKHITTIIAMQKYGICRLSERCRELERQGHRFSREVITIINRHGHKCKFVAYSLKESA